jgi:hypothetical protein
MKIVVLVIVGGVSSVLDVVCTPLSDVRSKWFEVISNLQSNDADAKGGRETRSNDTKERDRIIIVDCCYRRKSRGRGRLVNSYSDDDEVRRPNRRIR